MTSILKAFQELERRNLPGEPAVVAPMPPEPRIRTRRALVFALVPVATVALALGLLWGLLRSPARAPAVTSTAAVEERPAAAPDVMPVADAVANGSSAARPGVDDAVPWGKIRERQESPPAPPAARARPQRVAPVSAPVAREKTKPRERKIETSSPIEHRRVEQGPATGRPAPSAEAPRVDVRAITFSPDSTKRRVTLRINDGAPLVMKEGESERGVEVQLILQGVVYVRHGGNVMSIGLTH